MRTLFLVASILVLVLPAQVQGQAKTNILFILDGSNSMWGQVDGEAKVTSAQNVMVGLLKDLPADIQIGLMAYGHREEGSCEDIEVLSGIGENSTETLAEIINALSPKGKTPIAGALHRSLSVLSKYESDNNNVVLISDGIESCNGDPCSAAKALADAGINARVHVVGFDVGAEERKQLECIPEMGNGKFFSAANAAELKLAVAEVQELATADPPPQPEIWFEDNFDGEELGEHWVVSNPDPEAFIVEDGKLLMLNNKLGGLKVEGGKNTMTLIEDLPQGDFDAIATFSGEMVTGADRIDFGLWKDHQNHLIATLWGKSECCRCAVIALTLSKMSGGEDTSFSRPLRGNMGCGGPDGTVYNSVINMIKERNVVVTLSKRGRSYTASLQIEGEENKNGEPIVYSTQSLTSLRSPGDLSFAVGKHEGKRGGEILIYLDSVKVIDHSAN